MITFAQQLGEILEANSMNQSQLAQIIGKNRSSVSMYLSGSQEPSDETKQEIARKLGLASNFFDRNNPATILKRLARTGYKIPMIDIKDVATLMELGEESVRSGIKNRDFDFGYAINNRRIKIPAQQFADALHLDLTQYQ